MKKEMYVAAFPASHYALNAVPNAAPCTAVILLLYFVTDLKNHLTSVITVNRSGPVPMTSIFTVPIMPMSFTNEIKVSSRSGINQTPESLEQLDQLVSPFLP